MLHPGDARARLCDVLAAPEGKVPKDVLTECTELGAEIMNDGNREVQDLVLGRLKSNRSGAFLVNAAAHVRTAKKLVKSRRGMRKAGHIKPGSPPPPEYKLCCTTLNLMQLFCEGHNLQFQEFLRDQVENTRNINMLKEAVELLQYLAKKEQRLREADASITALMQAVMDFVIEATPHA